MIENTEKSKQREMTPDDADNLAKEYMEWITARNATRDGGGTVDQKKLVSNTPTIANRPAWISKLTANESKLFEEALGRLS